ncbi:MAG: hypothetical protein OWT28_00355 [Firmicutes bacterium]|nr:hypothetical protein [Bacillota bacterium]
MLRLLAGWSSEEDRLLKSLILQRVSRGGTVKEACLQFSLDLEGAHSPFASYWRWQTKLAKACKSELAHSRQLAMRATRRPAMPERAVFAESSVPEEHGGHATDQLLENVLALVDANKKNDLNLQELRSALDVANRNSGILEQERASLAERLAEREHTMEDLNARLYALDDTCRTLEGQLATEREDSACKIQDLFTRLTEMTDRYETSLESYETLQRQAEAETQALQAALSSAQIKYNERVVGYKEEVETAHAETSALRAELVRLASRHQSEHEEWAERFALDQEEIKRLQDELFSSREEHLKQIALLQQEFATERGALAASAAQVEHHADKRLQEAQLGTRQLVTSLEELRERYAEQSITVEGLRHKLQDARDEYTQVMEEYTASRAKDTGERAALTLRLQELEQEAEVTKRAHDIALTQLRETYESTRNELQILQDKHRKIVEEYGHFRSESERQTATLFKEVWDAMVRNNELLAQYTKVKDENTRLVQNVADFSRQVTSAFAPATTSDAGPAVVAIPVAVEAVRSFDSPDASEFAKARFQRLTGKE